MNGDFYIDNGDAAATLRDRVAFADKLAAADAVAPGKDRNPEQPTDLARLNDTIDRLFAQKRQELLDLELLYSRQRQETAEAYQRHISAAMHERAEKLRAIDKTFEAERNRLCELVGRLEAMRE
jgi:hypothetical protein